jgi:signal recognition particle subunit SRP54
MFDSLSDKLQDAFKKLRGQARLTEANISDSMREIRMAMLEADVNLEVVKSFISKVREDCLGEDVLRSISPGQQVVKIVNDRLTELMGESEVPLNLSSTPSVIMMVGLHGGGKTTSAAKLALRLKNSKMKVMLVAGDIYRPAAIDQLEILGNEIGVPVYSDRHLPDVAAIASAAVEKAKFEGSDVVIIDTAGRLQIDESMVQELVRVSQVSRADEILLVADSALGQEAVSVADHFHKALGLTGIVLTKLDGDARGGAALSIREVTGCPIKYIGAGEKVDDLEIFYPDRMASRILGMGDVVTLVEKAAEKIDHDEALKLHDKLKKNKFDFNDFLAQLRQMSNLGGAGAILKMLPGGKQLSDIAANLDPKFFKHIEAMIQSMTPDEREKPEIIDFSRRKRIAAGSGTSLEQISKLIKQFSGMRKMLKKSGLMGKLFSGGGAMPDMAGGDFGGAMPTMGGFGTQTISTVDRDKRKRLKKLAKKQKKKQRKKR